jgi:hypothetical protein
MVPTAPKTGSAVTATTPAPAPTAIFVKPLVKLMPSSWLGFFPDTRLMIEQLFVNSFSKVYFFTFELIV